MSFAFLSVFLLTSPALKDIAPPAKEGARSAETCRDVASYTRTIRAWRDDAATFASHLLAQEGLLGDLAELVRREPPVPERKDGTFLVSPAFEQHVSEVQGDLSFLGQEYRVYEGVFNEVLLSYKLGTSRASTAEYEASCLEIDRRMTRLKRRYHLQMARAHALFHVLVRASRSSH